MKKRWIAVCAAVLVGVGAYLAPRLKASMEKESAYQDVVQLVMDEKYDEAFRAFYPFCYENYKDAKNLKGFCQIAEAYRQGYPVLCYDSHYDFLFSFRFLSADEAETLDNRIEVMKSAYREREKAEKEMREKEAAKRREDQEKRAEEIEEYVKDSVPFEGMPESLIAKTSLGEPKKYPFSGFVPGTERIIDGSQYRFFRDGTPIFEALCADGEVVKVWDQRSAFRTDEPKAPSRESHTAAGSDGRPLLWDEGDDEEVHAYDEYHAAEYDNEEDFYEDHYYDFSDFYDAESYWRDHQP